MPCSAGVITYNPFSFAIGSQPWDVRPPEVGLAHELIHAYHDVTNTASMYWLIEETNTVGLTGNSPYTENGVRGDYGLPQSRLRVDTPDGGTFRTGKSCGRRYKDAEGRIRVSAF